MRLPSLLILLASIALGLGACSRETRPVSGSQEKVPTTASGSLQSKLNRIFVGDMIDANVAYLETITGPAFKEEADYSIYLVDGCRVLVGKAAGKIENLGMEGLSPKCHFDLGSFMSSSDHPFPKEHVTFADIGGYWSGRYDADCLSGCGNAADPVIYLRAGGSHADDYSEVVASIPLATVPVIDAADEWKAAIAAKHGEDTLAYGTRCLKDDDETEVAAKAFGAMHPETIRVGHDIAGLERCDKGGG